MDKKNDNDGRLLAIALSLVSGLPIIDFEFPDDTRMFLLYDKQHGKVADASGWHDRDMFPYHVLMKKRLPLVRDGYKACIRTPQELGFSKDDDDRIRKVYSTHKDTSHIRRIILDSGHDKRKNIPFSCRLVRKNKDMEDFLFHDGRVETEIVESHLFLLWAGDFTPFAVLAERRNGSSIKTRIFKEQHEGTTSSHCVETKIGDIVASHFDHEEFSFVYETDDTDPVDNLIGRLLGRDATPVPASFDGEIAACMALMERQRLGAKTPSRPRNAHSI